MHLWQHKYLQDHAHSRRRAVSAPDFPTDGRICRSTVLAQQLNRCLPEHLDIQECPSVVFRSSRVISI